MTDKRNLDLFIAELMDLPCSPNSKLAELQKMFQQALPLTPVAYDEFDLIFDAQPEEHPEQVIHKLIQQVIECASDVIVTEKIIVPIFREYDEYYAPIITPSNKDWISLNQHPNRMRKGKKR